MPEPSRPQTPDLGKSIHELEPPTAFQVSPPMQTYPMPEPSTRGNAKWDEIVQHNKDETMERWRAEVSRLRNWIDTEGRNCPSNATVDAVLEESLRVAG